LRQIDNDGKETFSKVISIVTKGNAKLNVYPNPVSNTLTIETDFDMARNEANRDYQITNLLGQTVLRGTASTQINVSALPQGSYILKVGAEQVKFIKQ
jgi:Secretion system C-terminal sorting domain